MAATRTYLDYNATAPLRAGALNACLATLAIYGNPSSIHREGREARACVEEARSRVARLMGAPVEGVVFTSGGTEAANLLLTPNLHSDRAPRGVTRLITVATEHASVLQGHRFPAGHVTVIGVDANGQVDLEHLGAELRDSRSGPALVALQMANSETGVIQPVRDVADLVRRWDGLLVCDAVQAVGRVPFSLDDCGADAAFVSGHKLGGPKGTGAAVLAEGVSLDWPLVRGGGQERGFRSGTENVAGLAGFGAAAEEAVAERYEARLTGLRDALEARLRAMRDDIIVFGRSVRRLPNTSCFAVPGLAANTLLMALDLEGVAVSSGSACSSGKVGPSHVLGAMGVDPDLASGALRVSFGWASTEADVDRFTDAFSAVMRRMQKRSMSHAA